MLENIKQLITLKTIERMIHNKEFEPALERLNILINESLYPKEAYLLRGNLCNTLLMYDEAYSDYTYVITHDDKPLEAYVKRMILNFETSNYYGAISDAQKVLELSPDDFNASKIKFLSLVNLGQTDESKKYLNEIFNFNKYKTIQFLLNETATSIAEDELGKGLKLLEVLDLIDKDNPMKLLKEATIYGIAGDNAKKNEILTRIDSVFPKYFVSHFKFGDIYDSRDLLEICFLLELKVFDTHNLFAYPLTILEGYKYNMEGKITDSKECFERAIKINPEKPEAYVLLGETLQLMSGYGNTNYKHEAEANYKKALEIYETDNAILKADNMKRQIKHLNSEIKIEQ